MRAQEIVADFSPSMGSWTMRARLICEFANNWSSAMVMVSCVARTNTAFSALINHLHSLAP